jgi:hypothetical protein
MRLRRLYRAALLMAAGGALFQVGAPSCQEQVVSTLSTTLMQALVDAFVSALTASLTTGTTT